MLQPLFLQATPAAPGLDVLLPILSAAVPAALGLAAVFLLLPRPRPYPVWAGLVLGAVALALLGALLAPTALTPATAPETVLFYLFAAVAIVSGVLLVTQSNPARAALSFALVVLSTCGLFLLLAAPFLMVGTIIIYAGAIIVTFLFVIMLAQQEGPSDADQRSREPLLSAVAGFVLLGALLYVLRLTYGTEDLDAYLHRADEAQAKVEELQHRAAETTPERVPDLLKEVDAAVQGVDGLRAGLTAWMEKGQRGAPEAGPGPLEPLENALRGMDVALVDVKEQQFRLRDRPQAKTDDLARALDAMGAALVGVRDAGLQVRGGLGTVQPDPKYPLSDFSGTPANVPPAEVRRDEQGRPQLPAENVAYLGRSLFTDYLLPVELAGTLLLVAAVGAIAIAKRRPESPAALTPPGPAAPTPGRNA